MNKEENPIEEDNTNNDENDSEPFYEPEECENCLEEMEANGIEYLKEFTWQNGTWVCDHCGMPQ